MGEVEKVLHVGLRLKNDATCVDEIEIDASCVVEVETC